MRPRKNCRFGLARHDSVLRRDSQPRVWKCPDRTIRLDEPGTFPTSHGSIDATKEVVDDRKGPENRRGMA